MSYDLSESVWLLPVIFSPKWFDELLGAEVDDGSKRAASSSSAFTSIQWTERVRKSVVKNRKPNWELQLRINCRFVFRLLGGPMFCSCCLRVFWLFTLSLLLYFLLELFECVGSPTFSALATKAYFLLFLFYTTLRFFSFLSNFFWDECLSVFIMPFLQFSLQ